MAEKDSKTEESLSKKPPVTLRAEIDRFIRDLEALKTSLEIAAGTLSIAWIGEQNKFNEFLEKHGTVDEDDGNTRKYSLGPEFVRHADRHQRRIGRFHRGLHLVPRSFLQSLVAQYDYFLGRILRSLYYLKPELLDSSERSLSLSQLIELGSVEEAREYLIEKEIETLLRKSHVEQFEWLENKFRIQLRKGLDSWPTFVEFTQRRNLFAHCNGYVSTQYLIVCREQGVEFGETVPSVGDQLNCSPTYFECAYHCIFEIGVKLAQVLWRKVRPDQLSLADENIMDVSFELLLAEEYSLLIRLLEFVTDHLKKFSSEEIRRILRINHALAHKWSGNNDSALKIIDTDDWSACSDKFQLAIAVLRDQLNDAAKIMLRIGKNGQVDTDDYRDWPLFREFRESKPFLEAYEEIFGQPFVAKAEISDSDGRESTHENPNGKPARDEQPSEIVEHGHQQDAKQMREAEGESGGI